MANPEISSDSTTLYLLFLVLILFSTILITIFSFFSFWKRYSGWITKAIRLVLTYYLAVILLKYGLDKIFMIQFYLPEPNTLYTPLGMLDKDILYWSTMGTSEIYNVFMGLMEALPALLLLYRKTRILGLFILSGVLINVVFINLGFDISVKLYSLFLLLLCGLLLVPNLQKLFDFFVLNKSTALSQISGRKLVASKPIRLAIKATVIVFIFAESLFPYLKNGKDSEPRNQLNGAYEIIEVQKTAGTNPDIKRFFIHRHNYFIFQYEDDSMEDFRLEVKPAQGQFILTDYDGETIILQYKYSESSEFLELKSTDLGFTIYSKAIPWRNLPLLQPLFHWTVDGI